jgi:aspartate ammonia-lyase
MMDGEWRLEKDSLGEVQVPASAYFGAQTQRAVENFPLSGRKPHPILVDALVLIKIAAAQTNLELGGLSTEVGEAIIQAGQEVLQGAWRDQFVVDVFQAGAGTSLHMNINEVLANRAGELLGEPKGAYSLVHPHDQVNLGQSTNDVFPTAMRLAVLMELRTFYPEAEALIISLKSKAREFAPILKAGRTHLMDAVPITLGQEFNAYGLALEDDVRRLQEGAKELLTLGLGGTAVGTGLNALPGYQGQVIVRLQRLTSLKVKARPDLVEAMQNLNPLAQVAGHLKLLALTLNRIANDLRLLSSGPQTGLAEIQLPAMQPGSSIMSGKVNPVICEALNMVCYQVIGLETTVALAAQAGQLELNVMMPLVIHNLMEMIDLLRNGMGIFYRRAIRGITANPQRCTLYLSQTQGLATFLNPYIGYSRAAALAQESTRQNIPLLDLLRQQGLFSEEQLQAIFPPEALNASDKS